MIIGDPYPAAFLSAVQSYENVKGNVMIYMFHGDRNLFQKFTDLGFLFWCDTGNDLQLFFGVPGYNAGSRGSRDPF